MIKALTSIFLFILLIAGPAYAAESILQTSAKQAIVIDFETGMVLFEKNADERMPTSSMSKVITTYLVFEALKGGQIKLDDKFQVSEKAWRKGGSKMFVEVDKRVKVEDLLRGVIVQSGNDATIVLAEGLAGTEGAFADALNVKAKELGMTNSHFTNASGWPDPDHYSTARDLVTLSYSMINNFPDYYPYFAEKEFTFNNIKQRNRNPLIYRDLGADGIKTGHTEAGGYGLMASGAQNGRRVVLVINGLKNEKDRAQESAKMLEWGLRGFQNLKLFKAGEVVDTVPVVMGQEEELPLLIEDDVVVTVPTIAVKDLKVELLYEGPLMAPIKKGQALGMIRITIPRGHTLNVPVLAGADIKPFGFFAKTLAKAKLSIMGKAGS